MAPRSANVTCTQCGKPFPLEPDQCDCGCQGFSVGLSPSSPKTAVGARQETYAILWKEGHQPSYGFAIWHPVHGISVTTVSASSEQAQAILDKHPEKVGTKVMPVVVGLSRKIPDGDIVTPATPAPGDVGALLKTMRYCAERDMAASGTMSKAADALERLSAVTASAEKRIGEMVEDNFKRGQLLEAAQARLAEAVETERGRCAGIAQSYYKTITNSEILAANVRVMGAKIAEAIARPVEGA